MNSIFQQDEVPHDFLHAYQIICSTEIVEIIQKYFPENHQNILIVFMLLYLPIYFHQYLLSNIDWYLLVLIDVNKFKKSLFPFVDNPHLLK